MKSTKNILRVIFCLIMTLVIVFSMVSCDIKGAFASLGDGDFKGAWNALIGKHTHEHAAVVTAPTCTEGGYTTYTCECGDTYVGDKVAALGHDYKEKVTRFPTPYTEGVLSNLCMRCGAHTDESLQAVAFELPAVSDFLRSIVGKNVLEINAEDAQYIHIKEIYSVDEQSTHYEKEYITLQLGQVEINGEGEDIYAYVKLIFGVARYETSDPNEEPNFDEQTVITVIVNGEDVFVSIDEDGYGEGNYKLSKLFYDAVASSYGMTYDQFVEMVYVSGKASALAPIIQNVFESLTDIVIPDDAGLKEFLELLADEFIEVDGNVYKLDLSGLADMVASVQGKTVAEAIDEQYGAGTMARIEDFVISLPTAKLRDIADAALKFSDKCGVALDDVYALINYVIYAGTGVDFNIESEIITRYDMTLIEVIVEISGEEDVDIAEITENLTENLREILANVKEFKLEELMHGFIQLGSPAPLAYGESGSASNDEQVMAEITFAEDGTVEYIYIYIEGVLNVSAGYDEGGYSATVEYLLDGDSFKYYVDANELDTTIRVVYNEHEVYYAYLTNNELGELLSVDVVTKNVVYISSSFVDEFGNLYIETIERVEDGITVKYVNNGDGTHTLNVLESEYSELNVEATVTETEESVTVTGTLAVTYYSTSEAYTLENGTFTYSSMLDGSGASLNVQVNETTYDFTSEYGEFGEEINRTYDYDNPKVYEIFTLEYAYDGNGLHTLDVDTNDVYHISGVSTVKDYSELHATLTATDDTVSVSFNYNEIRDELGVEAIYSVVEYEEGEEIYYYAILNSLSITYTDGNDINLAIKYTMTETEQGAKFSFDIDGYRYYEYSYDYIPSVALSYDGSPVTIVFYHTMGANLQQVLDEYIADFNAMYPNINIVHYQVGGYDDVYDQIRSDLVYGYAPNIAYCYPEHVATYNLTGQVVPLDAFINSNNLGFTEYELNDFIDGFYAEGAVYDEAGTMYTLPMSKSTDVLYYNKTFFEEHGLTVPTTWEEMEAVCEYIKSVDPDCIPLGVDSEANWFITMCEQLGTPYTSVTGDHFLFDTPENHAFVKMFREWYDKGYFTTAEIYGGYTSNLFSNGNSYMSIGSSAGARHQLPPAGEDGWPAFVMGIAPIPQVDPANPKMISQGPSICMFDQDNKQEVAASWLFMKFLTTNPQFQAEFSMASGYLPVIESAQNVPAYRDFLNNAYPTSSGVNALAVKTAFEFVDACFVSPAFRGSSAARDQVGLLMQYCFVTGATDIDTMIAEAFKRAVAECEYYAG